jgi:hypothetical protein
VGVEITNVAQRLTSSIAVGPTGASSSAVDFSTDGCNRNTFAARLAFLAASRSFQSAGVVKVVIA